VRLDLVRKRVRAGWEHTNLVPHAFREPRRSGSGDPSVVLVMEPTEDRSRNNVLGRDPSRGRQPTCAERWLHAKTAVGSAMIVATIFLQHAVGVDIIAHNDVVETIAA